MAAKARLIIDLIGRICLVKDNGQRWAVFLKADRSKTFRTRRAHIPALTAPLDRVASQDAADKSIITVGSFTRGKGKALAESLGVWPLRGYDIEIAGVATNKKGAVRLSRLANLRAIVKAVDPKATFDTARILAKNPDPNHSGIIARLKIPKGASISARMEDSRVRTFVPGRPAHQQKLADYIHIEIPFANPFAGPALKLRRFGSTKANRLKFLVHGRDDLKLTMSNLCNCVEQPTVKTANGTMVSEDREFVVFYRLLTRNLPANRRPVPQVANSGGYASGVDIPECYRPGGI